MRDEAVRSGHVLAEGCGALTREPVEPSPNFVDMFDLPDALQANEQSFRRVTNCMTTVDSLKSGNHNGRDPMPRRGDSGPVIGLCGSGNRREFLSTSVGCTNAPP